MVASTIVVVEPCTLLREGLVRALNDAGLHVQSAAHPLQLPPDFEPALLLVGFDNKHDMPVQLIKSFKERYESARIFALTNSLDCSCCEQALAAGANALLSKDTSFEVLISGIELVLKGETVLPSLLVPLLFPANPNPSRGRCREAQNSTQHQLLSARELHVLHRLAAGEPNKLIARHMQIAESTVKVHIKAILRKIGVTNRTQAALWATSSKPEAVLALQRDRTDALWGRAIDLDAAVVDGAVRPISLAPFR